jgi:hypothetical protein
LIFLDAVLGLAWPRALLFARPPLDAAHPPSIHSFPTDEPTRSHDPKGRTIWAIVAALTSEIKDLRLTALSCACSRPARWRQAGKSLHHRLAQFLVLCLARRPSSSSSLRFLPAPGSPNAPQGSIGQDRFILVSSRSAGTKQSGHPKPPSRPAFLPPRYIIDACLHVRTRSPTLSVPKPLLLLYPIYCAASRPLAPCQHLHLSLTLRSQRQTPIYVSPARPAVSLPLPCPSSLSTLLDHRAVVILLSLWILNSHLGSWTLTFDLGSHLPSWLALDLGPLTFGSRTSFDRIILLTTSFMIWSTALV